jgi:signal transduction histidine kinase
VPVWCSVADVAALGQEVVGALQAAATSKGLQLLWEDHTGTATATATATATTTATANLFERLGDASLRCHVDPLRLRQVVRNLVANAVKYTAQGGVRVRLDRATAANGQPELRLSVIDTGPGLDAKALARLFKPYSPGDTGLPNSSGLGLALSQQLATLMQGHIDVTSTLGRGAVFVLQLPLQEVPLEALKTQPASN